ncbi:MAG: DUF1343 domain-containing protein, partial [Clostridiales bacterium]|nr:DUF1343 domain-containing protein [Clostridiales bacterium]
YELPTRYGLTVGEYAQYIRHYLKLDLELTVAELSGWRRDMYLDDTDLPWVAPSPNCPSLASALVYPGTCIFEGTNVSEGRGTTQPFELIGAPWIEAVLLEQSMAELALPGVHFRRSSFKPTFSKHEGQLCQGVQLHIVSRDEADVCYAGLKLFETIRRLYPDKLEYLSWDSGKTYSLDLLLGTAAIRLDKLSADELAANCMPGIAAFTEAVESFLLYK